MFGNKKKIFNNFGTTTAVRSAILYYYNEDHEKIIIAILYLAFLTDANVKRQVDRLINELEQPEDTKMYAAIEGNEYRVY